MPTEQAKALKAEVASGNFPDARLTRRLGMIVERLADRGSRSLPKALKDSAELEGAYRFFSNPRVMPAGIQKAHLEATRERCEAESKVLVVHDSTDFTYRSDGERTGLGRKKTSQQTFFGHFSLALSADGLRRPLGLVGFHTWVRTEAPKGEERARWRKQAHLASFALGPKVRRVHVMDREADDYTVMAGLSARGESFVIRAQHDRILGEGERLTNVLARVEAVVEREAPLTRRRAHRAPKKAKTHPARKPRTARLAVSATPVTLKRPPNFKDADGWPPSLAVNVVRVWEPEPPEDIEPVEWLLLTAESIETTAELNAVVDIYRARWTIEEYFKALKTGCSFERRQLHDYETILNALAVFSLLAYHALRIRSEARRDPSGDAQHLLTEDQMLVLRHLGCRKLPEKPTNRDVMRAIAGLGGHIQYAPDPGWQTLTEGYEELEALTRGWVAAKLHSSRDQR